MFNVLAVLMTLLNHQPLVTPVYLTCDTLNVASIKLEKAYPGIVPLIAVEGELALSIMDTINNEWKPKTKWVISKIVFWRHIPSKKILAMFFRHSCIEGALWIEITKFRELIDKEAADNE